MAGNSRLPNDASKPCFEYQRNGNCKFGKRCRYSHGAPREQAGREQSISSRDRPGTRQTGARQRQDHPYGEGKGKLNEWKLVLRQGAQLSRPSPAAVGRFFQLGLELMDGDVGAAQEAIKHLASDEGLSFVKDVADRHILTADNGGSKVALWASEVNPLFQLITHPRVVNSAVLEQEVSTIYNFLIGIGGDRMIRLFSFVVNLVGAWPTSGAGESRMTTVELSFAVLSKMLDCNTTTMINKRLSSLVDRLAQFLNSASEASEDFSRMQATKYLEYIRRRLEVGDDIANSQALSEVSVARESFVLRRDLPGSLSAEGPRHDNDHANISKIKILPTTQEIMSPRAEYLPTNDPSQWHSPGIRGRLDREFRLLREDTVGQLRDAIRETIEHIRTPSNGKSRHSRNSVRTYAYDSPQLVDIEFDDFNGLKLVVRCDQPSAVQKLASKQRQDWWAQCKRLQAGGLVCILDATGSVLFFVVSDSTMRSKDDKSARKPTPQKQQEPNGNAKAPEPLTLSEDKDFFFARLQLVDPRQYEIGEVLRWYRSVGSSPRRHLVEFPGILLSSFKHTLEALQRMHQEPNIPFSDLLAPSIKSKPEGPVIRAPLYARKNGFAFDLKCLTDDKSTFFMNPQNPPAPNELASRSTLDLTQSSALLNTLSQELCLIQGPPGTGKSYTGEKIIRVLLAHKKQAKLGPIICVCYTNHALDQLLEHLLDDGTKGIIRIGSRSKSERLQDLNLRVAARQFDGTKSEKRELYNLKQTIQDIVQQTNNLAKNLASLESLQTLKTHLIETSPRHYEELFGESQEGWQTVNHHRDQIVKRWLAGGSQKDKQSRQLGALKAAPLSTMNYAERRLLHRHWIKSIRDPIIAEMAKLHQEHKKASEQRVRLRGDVDLRCLEQADVVGVTTTGLARQLDVLRKLRCKVMLCEEAGEVLEAHILTALLPSLENAILIGDHLQLRPQIQNYGLQSTNPVGQQYSLDMSLFERLVEPPHATDVRIPFSILETQRRMHPSISELIRSTLYPSLKDAETVSAYPDVVGIKERLFWLHHEQLEAGAASNDPLKTSHSNDFEIEMTAALVSHLIRQGKYGQGDIAVITPYLGQLHKLRRRMESMFEICLNDRDLDDLEALDEASEGPEPRKPATVHKSTLLKSVRVATVDNFQGEEAKVIVISLVRSNPQNKCGFLSTSNRINVLLSRAQHGMYIIGNAETYQNVPMWVRVLDMLKTAGHFGTELELQCPRHPDTPILVSQPDHFMQFSPESGCRLPCDKRLDCGHSCPGRCHSDLIHSAIKCLEDCPRPKKGCDHPCPLRCGDVCQEKCQVQLTNIDLALPCGHHLTSAKCWQSQDLKSIRCMVKVSRTVPGCNHQVQVRCHEDITAANYRCPAVCGHHRPCGHSCPSACFQCITREGGIIKKENHGICQQKCGRNYSTCRHSCSKTCHGETACPPCSEPCEVRCSHSRCSKPCNEPCAPCAERKCDSCCPHSECEMPCAAPCDWVPCSRRCEKLLSCGHQCPSLCGETCPDYKYCQQCASEDVKAACVDFIEMKTYDEIDLDEEPCIFPDCGHFLTVSSMDGQMSMASHYDLDENGLPKKLHGPSEPFSMDGSGIAVCANCRGPLRNISRYGRIVRRAMLDEATKKFVAWSNAQYLTLAETLFAEQERLENTPAAAQAIIPVSSPTGVLTLPASRLKQLQMMQQLSGNGRYGPIIKIWKTISSYKSKVAKEEQPFQRVADSVKHANRQHKTTQEFQFDESVNQVKGYLLATALLLKCDTVVFSDFIRLRQRKKVPQPEVEADLTVHFQDCERLINLARSSMHPREEVQGHIFCAQLCVLSRYFRSSKPSGNPITEAGTEEQDISNKLRERGLDHVAQARELLEKYQSTSILKSEIDAVEETLNDGGYRPVTTDEIRSVFQALAGELRGTGHWYNCENGHPFTIGECGMPMQEARCPECGAPIGGRNHQSVQGVNRATEIENIGAGRS